MPTEGNEFTYPRPNLVVSRDGYSVEVRLPNTILYDERDKRMSIFAESLATAEPTMAVRRQDVKRWEPPNEQVPVSAAEREAIIEKIRRGFEFKGWVVAVE